MSGKTLCYSQVWDGEISVEGKEQWDRGHPAQKCKGEFNRRHIWDRGHNRERCTRREGRVFIGVSSCGLLSSELKMMAVLLWNIHRVESSPRPCLC